MGLREQLEIKYASKDTSNSASPKIVTKKLEEVPWGEDLTSLKKDIHASIISLMSNGGNGGGLSDDELEDQIELQITQRREDLARNVRKRITKELMDEISGYGPIQVLLNDESITEVMVNGPDSVYVEQKGKLSLTDVKFDDEDHLMRIIDKIVSEVGRHVDEANPMVDARLKDGSRVNAIIPPISLKGAALTIRKFPKQALMMSDLIGLNSISYNMSCFLEACVKGRINIIVSGGTGSGKTTFLNILSGYIPETERIVTIEDSAELQLHQHHVVTLETRPNNTEGEGAVSIRDLVRNALRMRPDRIIVGEVRSGETLDMLQAMNTGHDGSLTTAHANNARDLLSRLETMVLMAGMDLPVRAIREQIASAINLIVQQSRMPDGSRKIVNISEITGLEGDTIVLQTIYEYKMEGKDIQGRTKGHFEATGLRPHLLDRLQQKGVMFSDTWFARGGR